MADYRLTPAAERDLESTESFTTVWMRGATCDASSLLVTECSMLRIGGFNLAHLAPGQTAGAEYPHGLASKLSPNGWHFIPTLYSTSI